MAEVPEEERLRAEARRRIEERRGFSTHVLTYVLINAVLVAIWATTGHGYFWPAWVLAGWGAAVVLHAWTAFVQRPVGERDIEREVERIRRSGGARV